jgi:2-polyprenyl-3-methyl-5-hydroxy-6-metoxy-1,4-benzoquinol methylase
LSCRAKYGFPFVGPGSGFYISATDLASETRHCNANTFGSHPINESALFENGNNKWLLDIGCGNGAFAEFAASVGYNVVGLDIDTKSIQVARSRCIRNAEFYVCDLDQFCSLGARTRSFDVVSMFEVFEHLENPFQTLLYVKTFLREGGAFIGSLPNTNRPLMWYFHMDYEMPPSSTVL